jgi:co-chaperonin GroES (HSP10)
MEDTGVTKKMLTDEDVAWMAGEQQLELFPNQPGAGGDLFAPQPHQPLPLIANRDKLAKRLGIEPASLPDDLFNFYPWGSRVVVMRDEPIRSVGKIKLPDSSIVERAIGTVVAVGPKVGTAAVGSSSPVPRERLLGCKVIFGRYSGQAVQFSVTDDDFYTSFVILPESDIWGFGAELPTEDIL